MADMPQGLRFAEFSFDPASGELRRNGERVPIEYQPSRVLAHLVSSPGRLIARAELSAAVWDGDTHVNFDEGLNYCIRQLRVALGDDAKTPRFIETVPRRGYRFVAEVKTMPRHQNWRRVAVAAGLAVTLLAGIAAESRPNNHHEMAVAAARAIHDLIF